MVQAGLVALGLLVGLPRRRDPYDKRGSRVVFMLLCFALAGVLQFAQPV